MGNRKYVERKVTIGDKFHNHNLAPINVGDTVAINQNAKLEWFAKETKAKVVGRIGTVVKHGKYVYTVSINDVSYHFSRVDLKKVV